MGGAWNLSTAALERVLNAGQRMCLGALGFAGGALWFAFSNGFLSALLALFLMGLGLGLFQVNYANLFSRGFGARSGAVMAVMSTSFAVGSIAGPSIAALLDGSVPTAADWFRTGQSHRRRARLQGSRRRARDARNATQRFERHGVLLRRDDPALRRR
ncbi:MAG: hypothetical protein HC933_20685 [Pleurocapsa sp. SU_196_0]|nr:hypothetical protein [Pleurocapsa sp. SU_196_0]